jgi:hypothetical protein
MHCWVAYIITWIYTKDNYSDDSMDIPNWIFIMNAYCMAAYYVWMGNKPDGSVLADFGYVRLVRLHVLIDGIIDNPRYDAFAEKSAEKSKEASESIGCAMFSIVEIGITDTNMLYRTNRSITQ